MVTVIDKQLYMIYKMFNERIKGNETEDVIDFVTTAAERYDAEDLADTVDFGKLIKAIIDGETVELHEPKYRVPLPHMIFSKLQQFLTFDEDANEDDGKWFATTSQHAIAYEYQQAFTMDEIPEEYRQWAEEVEDEL